MRRSGLGSGGQYAILGEGASELRGERLVVVYEACCGKGSARHKARYPQVIAELVSAFTMCAHFDNVFLI